MNRFSLKIITIIIALLFIQSKVNFNINVVSQAIHLENFRVCQKSYKAVNFRGNSISNSDEKHVKIKIRYKAGECNYYTLKEFSLKPELSFSITLFNNYYSFYFPSLFTKSSPLRGPPSLV